MRTAEADEYVVVFQPRHYEFSDPSPARLAFGPASRDRCEQFMREMYWNGGPGGGAYHIRKAKVEVTW